MWILFSCLSALFAGITSILAKCGIRTTNSTIATACRTIIVLVCSWGMVFVVGSQQMIKEISLKTWIFLILSGCATGASWLCYFKALQLGDINKVVPIDKSSTILTILLAFVFLHETFTLGKGIGCILMGIGTFLMIQKKSVTSKQSNKTWIIFALCSALFASLTAILGKIGIDGVESNLGTAIRTTVVLIMSWMMVFVIGVQKEVRCIPKKEMLYIILSGIATGASWLCYFYALQKGETSVVVSIDKLSILVTIFFSFIVFHEKLSIKAWIGLILVVVGTFMMLL